MVVAIGVPFSGGGGLRGGATTGQSKEGEGASTLTVQRDMKSRGKAKQYPGRGERGTWWKWENGKRGTCVSREWGRGRRERSGGAHIFEQRNSNRALKVMGTTARKSVRWGVVRPV